MKQWVDSSFCLECDGHYIVMINTELTYRWYLKPVLKVSLSTVNHLKHRPPVSTAAAAAAAAAVWGYRLQLVFHRRGCVVLQSPAISLFTEVKAVSCWVPGASIPIQWLIQACTGTLCNAVVSQYNVCNPAAPSSMPKLPIRALLFWFLFWKESIPLLQVHSSSLAVFLAFYPDFRSALFPTLNIIHSVIKLITASNRHGWKVLVWSMRWSKRHVIAVEISRYTCIWMYRWDVSRW